MKNVEIKISLPTLIVMVKSRLISGYLKSHNAVVLNALSGSSIYRALRIA